MNRPRVKLTPRGLKFVCPFCHHIEIESPPFILQDFYLRTCPACKALLFIEPGKPVDPLLAGFTNLDQEEEH